MGLETEILRYIEVLHREKDIDKEILFEALEEALAAAIRRKYDLDEEVVEVHIDRETGKVQSDFELDLADLGRIAATTAKQRLLQKLREAERDVLYEDFESRMGTLANGTVQRFEGDNVVISIGKVEGILPRKERVRGENYHVGDRIRCLVREVRKFGPKIKVVLTRANPDLVRRLFELEVPEIADGIIEIKSVEREPGYRTKLGVLSHDPKIDCVGACVGVRGTRIKSIIDELNGEKIDVIPWDDDPETLIVNALKPATVSSITLDRDNRKALVIVDEDQLSLAIGRRGQNVRLASRLARWEIDIMTREQLEASAGAGHASPPPEEESAGSEEAGREGMAPQGSMGDDSPLQNGAEGDSSREGAE